MAQTTALIATLKKTLKAHGKTYADVADALELSTPSVKRLFSAEALSLKRLDTICDMLGIEITDLVQQLADEDWQLRQLTVEQETAIADDIPLLLITVAVLNQLNFADILQRFAFAEHEVIRKLAWLDRQGFIDLLPGNRIRLKTAANFAWRPDGPIQRFFQRELIAEYFGSRFAADGEKLVVLNGMLSKSRLEQLHRRMELLAHDFDELVNDDRTESVEARNGQTVVIAVRPWRFGVFNRYIRD